MKYQIDAVDRLTMPTLKKFRASSDAEAGERARKILQRESGEDFAVHRIEPDGWVEVERISK